MTKLHIVFLAIFLLIIGCDEHKSSTSVEQDSGSFNPGEATYNVIEQNVSATVNGEQKVAVLRSNCQVCQNERGAHRERIIDSVNSLFAGEDVSESGEFGMEDSDEARLNSLLKLITDGTLPAFTDAIGQILQDLVDNKDALKAMAAFLNANNGLRLEQVVDLIRRLMDYDDKENLFLTIRGILERNPTALYALMKYASNLMQDISASPSMVEFINLMSSEVPIISTVYGYPVWAVRLDQHSNPAVRISPTTGILFKPFVDENPKDDVADVNGRGFPIDKNRKVIEILPFSRKADNGINRDQWGRAVRTDGELLYQYYDVKKTLLGVLLFNVGEAFQLDLLNDAVLFACIALLPKEEFTDDQGSYMGYSAEGDLLAAILGALDLVNKERTLQLLTGFGLFTEQCGGNELEIALIGYGKMIKQLRDEELEDARELEIRMLQIVNEGEIEEINHSLEKMAEVSFPPELGIPSPNMAALFVRWMAENSGDLSSNVLWPLRLRLLVVKESYQEDIADIFYQKLVGWACDEEKMAPMIPILLELLVAQLEENTEDKIAQLKEGVQILVTSRFLAELITITKDMLDKPGAAVIEKAILYVLTPMDNSKQEVFGELLRTIDGLFNFHYDLDVKISLLKVVGELLDPDNPLIINLMEVIHQLLADENREISTQGLYIAVSPLAAYEVAPLVVMGHALLEVILVDYPHQYQKLTEDQVQEMLDWLTHLILDPDELLQLIYGLLR